MDAVAAYRWMAIPLRVLGSPLPAIVYRPSMKSAGLSG